MYACAACRRKHCPPRPVGSRAPHPYRMFVFGWFLHVHVQVPKTESLGRRQTHAVRSFAPPATPCRTPVRIPLANVGGGFVCAVHTLGLQPPQRGARIRLGYPEPTHGCVLWEPLLCRAWRADGTTTKLSEPIARKSLPPVISTKRTCTTSWAKTLRNKRDTRPLTTSTLSDARTARTVASVTGAVRSFFCLSGVAQ